MKEGIRARLRAGDTLFGTIVTLPSPEIVEVLSRVGFDWLFIDAEHSALEPSNVQWLLQAAADRCPCLVRVPVGDEAWIKRVLDIGSHGIIVPQIRSAAEAHQIVRFAKYPPDGERGVGLARAHGFGLDFQGYVDRANQDTAVVLQVEHIDAVGDIDALVRVPGVDALFVGPYDLSASLGKIGEVDDPEVTEAIAAVRSACRDAAMPLGIFGTDTEAVLPYLQAGFNLICVGTDILLLLREAQSTLSRLRGT